MFLPVIYYCNATFLGGEMMIKKFGKSKDFSKKWGNSSSRITFSE